MPVVHFTYSNYDNVDVKLASDLRKTLASVVKVLDDPGRVPTLNEDDELDLQNRFNKNTYVVVLISNDTFSNYRCCREIELAVEQQMRILPLEWRGFDVDVVMGRLSTSGWPDDIPEDAIRQRLEVIKHEIGKRHWVSFGNYHQSIVAGTSDQEEYQLQARRLQRAILGSSQTQDALISYSRRNTGFVEPFKSRLDAELDGVWFDQDDIPYGANWLNEIQRGIESAKNCLFFVTNDWLASQICNDEYAHARQYNKRIVAIILEDYDVDAVEQIIQNKPWDRVPPEQVHNTIRETWQQLNTAQAERYVDLPLPNSCYEVIDGRKKLVKYNAKCMDDRTFQALLDRLNADNEHVTRHTELLIAALQHERGEGRLMTFGEYWQAWRWLATSDEQIPKPTNAHHLYVRNSLTNFLARLFGVAFTLSSIIAMIILAFATLRIQADEARLRQAEAEQRAIASELDAAEAREQTALVRAESAEEIAAETSKRLQTQAQLGQQRIIDLIGAPSRPVIAGPSLYVTLSEDTGYVQRFNLNGLAQGDPIPVGISPSAPVVDDQYIWVTSSVDNTLTRIERTDISSANPILTPATAPATLSETPRDERVDLAQDDLPMETGDTGQGADSVSGRAQTMELAIITPEKPFVAGDYVWLQSALSGTLLPVHRNTLEPQTEIFTGLNARQAFAAGDTAWFIDNNGVLQRVLSNFTPSRVPVPEIVREAQTLDESVWVVGQMTLYRFSPNGDLIRSYVFDNTPTLPVPDRDGWWVMLRNTD